MTKWKDFAKKVFAAAFVLAVIGGTQVYAYSSTSTYRLPAGSPCPVTHAKETDTCTISYRLIDVYPTTPGVNDSYKKIKIAAYKGNVCLLTERVISESSTITTKSYNAKLSKGDNVTFIMNGNDSSKSAYAEIYLDWE